MPDTLRERVARELYGGADWDMLSGIEGESLRASHLNRADAILAIFAEERAAADKRAYAVLAAYGVPKERAGSVSEGIAVMAERMRREIVDGKQAAEAREAKLVEACKMARADLMDWSSHDSIDNWESVQAAILAIDAALAAVKEGKR